MTARLRIAALLAVTLLRPDLAAADGALAITSNLATDGLAYGFVRNFSSGSAQAAALDTCRKMANTQQTVASCRIVGMFTNQCFAIALIPDAGTSTLGWAIDPDRQAAQRKALDGCAGAAGDDGKKCRIVQSRCDASTWADQCGGRNDASPDLRIGSCTALIGSGDESDADLVSDHVNRGNAHADRQEYDEAIADYGEALRRNGRHAVAFYDRGTAYRMKRDYDNAIADYDQAIALDPRYEDAFVNRGVAYAGKGDLDRAISEYTTALMLDATDAAAYRNRGDAYVDKGDPGFALQDYDEAIRRAPSDADAYRSRGYLHFYAGDFAPAADDLERVVRAERDDLYARLWAFLAAARSDATNATKSLTAAVPQQSPAWPSPVVELFLDKRTVEATLSAAGTAPQRCEAQFYVGEWKLLHGDKAGAVVALEAAAATCPKTFIEYKGARAELKRLGR
jgi:tetratricopeptide (TPR) repeat protein